MKKILKHRLYKDENTFNYFEMYEDFSKLTIRYKNNDYKIIKFDNEFYNEMIKFIWRVSDTERIVNQFNNDLGYILFGTNKLTFDFKNKDKNDFRRSNLTIKRDKRVKTNVLKYIYEECDSRNVYRRITVRVRGAIDSETGTRKSIFYKSFSIKKYGYNGALLQAIIARNKFLKTLK